MTLSLIVGLIMDCYIETHTKVNLSCQYFETQKILTLFEFNCYCIKERILMWDFMYKEQIN